ncbi:MAG: hypothetical protein HZB99_00265 [Candidatus Harrisonbacteria bacterium]|nr:hypothetical protein [Candidatus Harrisonbacteria bacterium]
MRIAEINPKKMEAQVLRQTEMQYNQAIEELRAEIKNGYEPTFFQKDRISLLKYDKVKKDLFAFTTEGTEEEIKSIQKAIYQAPT